MSAKHGPNSWDSYLAVHSSRLADFLGHFVLEDRLSFVRTVSQVYWQGVLECAGGIEIHVHKRQRVVNRAGRPWVQTVDYSYHVQRREGMESLLVFRYDNAAHHDHPDPHHRHEYDVAGREAAPPKHVGVEGWPTLGDVIEEAFDWWQSRGAPLP